MDITGGDRGPDGIVYVGADFATLTNTAAETSNIKINVKDNAVFFMQQRAIIH
jgi:hypothetical protein